MSQIQIEEEHRLGRIAGVATIAAGLLIAVSIVWGGIVNSDRPEDSDRERLRFFHDHAGELIGASAVRSLGFLLLILGVVHLQRATTRRNPEVTPVPLLVGVLGAIALAVGTLGQAVALAGEASDFVSQHFPSAAAAEEAAEDAARATFPLITSVIAFAGTIGLAFWFVMGSLNAMRIGLLTRFMGVLGIIVGPGFIFGFAPPVMVFWLIAVGVLFLGKWPRGLPPAWVTGEAMPWPGREPPPDVEGDELGAEGSRDGEVEAVGPGVKRAAGEEAGEPRANSRRKRKKRR